MQQHRKGVWHYALRAGVTQRLSKGRPYITRKPAPIHAFARFVSSQPSTSSTVSSSESDCMPCCAAIV